MAKATLTDLRNKLDEIMVAIAKDGDGAVSNTEAIEMIHAKHAKDIKALTPTLVNIALVKLANEVGNRKSRQPEQDGVDLFGVLHIRGIPKMISLGKNRKKHTIKTTFQEASLWLTGHQGKALQEGETRHSTFEEFLESLRAYSTSVHDTIGEAMERKATAEGRSLKGKANGGG